MQNSNISQKHQHNQQLQQQQEEEQDIITDPESPVHYSLPLTRNYPASESVTSDENKGDYLEARFECAICCDWLKEPVVTSCGHRFCKVCLNSWLGQKGYCPMDNKQLSDRDTFPDNFTRREIEQIKTKCPNSPLGCEVIASPLDVGKHLSTCPYHRPKESDNKCPFASVKCDFVGRPETSALEEHLKQDIPHHLQLMLQAFQHTAISTWNPQKNSQANGEATNGHPVAGVLPPPPPQYANEADEQLVQDMYHRIVVLEQRCREQDAKLENLTKQLSATRHQVDPRYSNGVIVWVINNFRGLVKNLRTNSNIPLYSHECYTSPFGYKFCARLNIQSKANLDLLSLHVHLMQSENDFHLDWPFKGRIKLCMIHPRDPNLSQHDTIMTKPEILAFHQPRERISTRGFGFVEYANIADILHKGFCEGDRVVIKIQINIV